MKLVITDNLSFTDYYHGNNQWQCFIANQYQECHCTYQWWQVSWNAPQGGISSSILSVFFTDKFALSQSDARISVAYKFVSDKHWQNAWWNAPPGLVHRQVVTFAFAQKLEDKNRSSRLCRMKSISNQLCMRNLEMINDNKKKLWQKEKKRRFLPLRVNVLLIRKFTFGAKNIQVQLEIHTKGKWSIPVV